MEILKTSADLTPVDEYFLTQAPGAKKMQDSDGQEIEFTAWAYYRDTNSKGEENDILALLTPEREVVGTISKTFIDSFFKMLETFKRHNINVTAIKVISGTTNAGRPFIDCVYAASEAVA